MSSGFRGERRPYGRGGGRGRGGRPSGLSGKEIGMYYKNLSQAKKKDTEKKEVWFIINLTKTGAQYRAGLSSGPQKEGCGQQVKQA